MDYSLSDSSVHWISQKEFWGGFPFSLSPWPRDQTCFSYIGRWILYHWATREDQHIVCILVKLLQLSSTLLDPMDCILPGSSVHGILKAKILEWVVVPSSMWSSTFRNWTNISCITGRFFPTELPGKPHDFASSVLKGQSFNISQFSSVTQSSPTLCEPMNHSMPGLTVHHQPPEPSQTHVHWVTDAIQPSHPLSSPSPPAPDPSQHHSLFQWVNSSHEVAKVLEFQL